MADEIPPGPQKATKMLPKDPNIEVRQMRSWRGHDGTHSVIHGLYRKELSEEEREVAEYLVGEWSSRYALDDGVDRAMLWEAVVNYLKARRLAPNEDKDHNKTDFKAQHSRLFREYIESLGLNRKQRKGEGDAGSALAALAAIVKKKEPEVIDTVERDGVHVPEGA